jgi:hypothetical protein
VNTFHTFLTTTSSLREMSCSWEELSAITYSDMSRGVKIYETGHKAVWTCFKQICMFTSNIQSKRMTCRDYYVSPRKLVCICLK